MFDPDDSENGKIKESLPRKTLDFNICKDSSGCKCDIEVEIIAINDI